MYDHCFIRIYLRVYGLKLFVNVKSIGSVLRKGALEVLVIILALDGFFFPEVYGMECNGIDGVPSYV